LVSDTPKDEQVNLSEELREILMRFVISHLLGVVAAAIEGNVDCENYFSHWVVLTSLSTSAYESVRAWALDRSS